MFADVLRLPHQHRLCANASLDVRIVIERFSFDLAIVEQTIEETPLSLGPVKQGLQGSSDSLLDPRCQLCGAAAFPARSAPQERFQFLCQDAFAKGSLEGPKATGIGPRRGDRAEEGNPER